MNANGRCEKITSSAWRTSDVADGEGEDFFRNNKYKGKSAQGRGKGMAAWTEGARLVKSVTVVWQAPDVQGTISKSCTNAVSLFRLLLVGRRGSQNERKGSLHPLWAL